MEGYLLDIVVDPHFDEINAMSDYLTLGIQRMKEVQLAVKILGENRFIIAVSSDKVEDVTKALHSYEYHLTINSLPIIDYERFARAHIGVKDHNLLRRNPPAKIDPSKPLFFVQGKVKPSEPSSGIMFDKGRQDALAALNMVYVGQVPITAYMALVSQMVVFFIQVDADKIDGISFIRALREQGDQQARGAKVIAMK